MTQRRKLINFIILEFLHHHLRFSDTKFNFSFIDFEGWQEEKDEENEMGKILRHIVMIVLFFYTHFNIASLWNAIIRLYI